MNFCAAGSLTGPHSHMSRQFPIAVAERRLRLCVLPADERWELWLCEGAHQLLLTSTISVDEAIMAWRGGCDAVAARRKHVIDQVQRGEIDVPRRGELVCPSRCNEACHRPARP